MATPASHPLHDQNRNILNHGITPGGTAKADKKGGGSLGGRKALKDISNARKPLVHRHPVRKDNSLNIFSTETDTKRKLIVVPEKGKVGSRKALTDVTNSAKPTSEQVAENFPSCVAEEGFLHDHQKCITAQTKAWDIDMGMDKDYCLKLAGLQQDISPLHLSARRAPPLTPKKPELFGDGRLAETWYFLPARHQSPPESLKDSFISFEDEDFCDFKMIATPRKLT